MTTIGVSISRLRNVFKSVNEDSFMTDRFIYHTLLKYAKALIRRQDTEDKLKLQEGFFEWLDFVELIEVSKIEAPDCAGLINAGCRIMRTKFPLPELMMGKTGPLLRNVTSIDHSIILTKTALAVYAKMIKTTTFKYNKNHYFWYKNGHLYFPDIEWDAVSVEGLFEESVEGYCTLDNKDCTPMQERKFSLPDHLFAEAEQLAEQELMNLGRIPSDVTGDNSQQILR